MTYKLVNRKVLQQYLFRLFGDKNYYLDQKRKNAIESSVTDYSQYMKSTLYPDMLIPIDIIQYDP